MMKMRLGINAIPDQAISLSSARDGRTMKSYQLIPR